MRTWILLGRKRWGVLVLVASDGRGDCRGMKSGMMDAETRLEYDDWEGELEGGKVESVLTVEGLVSTLTTIVLMVRVKAAWHMEGYSSYFSSGGHSGTAVVV